MSRENRAGPGGPAASASLWQRAASFSARAHRHQVRRDGETPYAAHPARVAMTCAVLFGETDPEVLAAAYLHDVIEDTDADYDEVEEGFGPRVAAIVAALTKNMALPESAREPEYDARLAAGPDAARLIKLADVFDNGLDRATKGDGRVRPVSAKTLNKIQRALSLTERDSRPATVRARAVVRELLVSLEARGL